MNTGMGNRLTRPRLPILVVALLAVLVVSTAVSVGVGATSVPLNHVADIVWQHFGGGHVTMEATAAEDRIVWQIRLPRTILAVAVGAGLALVGTALQAVTRNPLADPYLFGVSSGAAFGAVAVIVHVGALLGPATLPLAAFAGAMVAMLLVVGIAGRRARVTSERLILSGVAVSFLFFAATNFLIFWGDQRAAHSVVFWSLGGLGGARWDRIGIPVAVVAVGWAVMQVKARHLNALSAGDETAVGLGVSVDRMRLAIFMLAALVTGVLVAVSGAIGFVGLMIPHVARMAVGGDNRRVLPLSALIGAVFLVWVDISARVLLAPQELPVGMLTAAIGGAFFIWLIRRVKP